MIARYATALAAAAAVTFGLFWLMQYLIIGQKATLDESKKVRLIDFVRLQRDTQVETKDRKPPDRPPPPEAPPEPPKMSADPTAAPSGGAVDIGVEPVQTDMNIAGGPGGDFAVADAEAIPLFRMAPQYPERAASRGIEGYVVMEFTITETGTVTNIKVVEANPPGMFDRAAIKAMEKWKYKPKIVDGKPVSRHGVRNQLTFKLNQ